MTAGALLDVAGLVVGPRDRAAPPILDGVGFRLDGSEILGLYGASGAGKTILCRALADWLPDTLVRRAGRVAFAGADIAARPRDAPFRRGRDIAYIGSRPQSALDPTLPVGRQIVEKLRGVRPEWSARECRERVLHLLAEVRIPSPKERFWDDPSKFSGGMMQRAMIVDAICAEPAVLIADDITKPLDATVGAQIVALLHDLCRCRAMATLFVSSSLPTLGQFGRRTAVLHGGRIVEEQAFADLLADPRTNPAREAVAGVPRLWAVDAVPAGRPRPSAAAPLMRIETVVRTYRARRRGTFTGVTAVQAVRGVTLNIMAGETLGIVGESGCGKSTLTRMLGWLEVPDAGGIAFEGTDLAALSPRQLVARRHAFQLLLQDPHGALPPRTTVGRMIEEGLRIRRGLSGAAMRARVLAAMADVGLPGRLYDELPHGLSTGDRQRIAIARALVLEPRLLILDETLSALDQREQGGLIALFTRLQEANDLTYVVVAHDLAMVRSLCTRVAVMYLGLLVEVADNRDLFFDPWHPYTRALLAAAPTLEQNPFAAAENLLDGEPPSPIDIPPGCSFAPRCPLAFARCRVETPALVAHAPGRLVACHLIDRGTTGMPHEASPTLLSRSPGEGIRRSE